MTDWKQETENLRQQGSSWTEIAEAMQNHFPELNRQQVLERVRGHIRRANNKTSKVVGKDKVVGVISDLHLPFAHENYIHFLEDTFNKYGVTDIVNIGDLTDNHAISRWQKSTSAHSANMEYELARRDIEIYKRAFPELDLVLGNHDLIPQRQCATLGIPEQFVTGFHQLWDLPKKWRIHEQIEIDGVMYTHGIGANGKNGALDRAISNMQSSVIGHCHSFGGIQYHSNSKHLIFGMNTGCGIDIDKYAFEYGKYNKNRETLGCGIVFNESNAIFVPMDNRYFRK